MPGIISRLFSACVLAIVLSVVVSLTPANAQTSGTAATPTFSVSAGVYTAAQSVDLSDTTPGAVIHYTLNWLTPNASSPVYSGPITISKNTTLKAIAIAAGYTNSPVATAIYTIRTAQPAYSPAPGVYPAAQLVTLSDTTPGAQIYYTLDNTWPTNSSTPYTGPISISKNTIVRAAAYAPGYGTALTTLQTYYIRAATPTLTPPPGTYTDAQSVVISDTTPGAVVHYTLDNSQPSTSSPVYSGPIPVSNSTIVHAVAFATGLLPSLPTPALLYWLPYIGRAEPPAFSVRGGTYTSAQSITISDSAPNANIYYTTDGSTPYLWSTQYSGPITVSKNTTLKAIAAATGYNQSAVASASYAFQPADPAFSAASGGYLHSVKLTITDTTPGATLYYTTDGSTPSATHGVEIRSGGSILVAASQTISAVAVAAITGWAASSNVVSNSYVIDPSSTMPHEWTLMNTYPGYKGPNARMAAATWTDSSGNFWLFGGNDMAGNGSGDDDMWKFSPINNQWTKVSGMAAFHYGSLGVPDGANVPRPRSGAVTWTDKDGNFWMFGGGSRDWMTLTFSGLNDLWMFNPNAANSVTGTNGVWTWMGGSQMLDQPGVYSTKGVANGSNVPAGRYWSAAWADENGNFWLFGGTPYKNLPLLNDLWEFIPGASNSVTGVNGVWVWMGGSSTSTTAAGVYNTQGVANGSSYPGGRHESAGWTDASGNFWLFGGYGTDSNGVPDSYYSQLNDLWEFNPNAANSSTGINGVWTWVSGSDINGGVETADSPGVSSADPTWKDLNGNFWLFNRAWSDMWSFNPETKKWTREGSVNDQPSPAKLAPSPGVGPSQIYAGGQWTDANGYLWVFGIVYEYISGSWTFVPQMWLYDPDPPVPTPIISPATGSYTAPQSVTITDSDAGATIYYTTDGNTPTTSSLVYNGPIVVSGSEVVVALAVKGRANSNLAAATYSF